MTKPPAPSPSRALLAATGAVLLAAGFAAGRFSARTTAPPEDTLLERRGGSRWTTPLLDCEHNMEFSELRPFKKKAEETLEAARRDGRVDEASVYFRDLNNGVWFGIEEKSAFLPASLLKVPLAVAAYKRAEEDRDLLRKTVSFGPAALALANQPQRYSSSGTMKPGPEYPFEDLIARMLRDSDNLATMLVQSMVPAPTRDAVYADLGLLPPSKGGENEVRVKQYASFFRILYNASYLDRARSEKILSLLAQSSFRDGLVAGVPPGTPVAHKYGERAFGDGDRKQLHDCGIVYYPRKPYLLCVMTRGPKYEGLAQTIRDLSRTAYAEVDAQMSRSVSR